MSYSLAIDTSRGRVSSSPLGEKLGGFGVERTLGRTVADAAALLDLTGNRQQGIGNRAGLEEDLDLSQSLFPLKKEASNLGKRQQESVPRSPFPVPSEATASVMSGYVLGDPYWLPAPSISFLEATKQMPMGLRIGFATTMQPIGAAHPVCTQAVVETVQLLEQLGHSTESIEPDFSELIEPLKIIWQATVDVGVPRFFLGKLNRFLLR